jgi:hypothetical protein
MSIIHKNSQNRNSNGTAPLRLSRKESAIRRETLAVERWERQPNHANAEAALRAGREKLRVMDTASQRANGRARALRAALEKAIDAHFALEDRIVGLPPVPGEESAATGGQSTAQAVPAAPHDIAPLGDDRPGGESQLMEWSSRPGPYRIFFVKTEGKPNYGTTVHIGEGLGLDDVLGYLNEIASDPDFAGGAAADTYKIFEGATLVAEATDLDDGKGFASVKRFDHDAA